MGFKANEKTTICPELVMSRFPFCFCSPKIKVSGDGQTDTKDNIHSLVLAPCITFLCGTEMV